jgi:hypothetical protein
MMFAVGKAIPHAFCNTVHYRGGHYQQWYDADNVNVSKRRLHDRIRPYLHIIRWRDTLNILPGVAETIFDGVRCLIWPWICKIPL